ncbi:TRAP transporter small permease [Ramlibacter terrae]|uniref:TRAP transporter small permease protein n=1 Tax=Ramlibacter terrae TaxID=2732511 RepID=A0ABX6P0G1_9BURK|nr:TRAP transporter small permease [Ramlibacter terrae]
MQTQEPSVIERGIALACRGVLWLSFTVIFLIPVANTILRYATGASLQWASEVPELLFPWLVMAGVVLGALQGAHITTTFLMDAIPANARRVVGTVSWMLVAGLYATLSVATGRMLEVVRDEKSPILQLPGSITYACVMGGMVLLAIVACLSAWRTWRHAATDSAASEAPVGAVHW